MLNVSIYLEDVCVFFFVVEEYRVRYFFRRIVILFIFEFFVGGFRIVVILFNFSMVIRNCYFNMVKYLIKFYWDVLLI